jgi:prepilin-type N-terminal cleavage/methylation domain-containing protein
MNRGFSLIELLIAMAVATLTMTAVVVFIGGGQSFNTDSLINIEALHKAQDLIETAAANARIDYTSVAASSITDCSDGLCYAKQLSIPSAYATQCTNAVVGTVSWTGERNRALSVSATTTIVNIPEMIALGGSCSPTLPGTWDNPSTRGDLDITPSGSKGTAVDMVLISGTRYAFLTSVHSAAASDDFWVIDADDATNPSVIASLNTGVGLNDIDVVSSSAGVFAYVIQNDTVNQLQTIDVTDPTTPSLVSTISLEPYGVSPTGSDPEPHVITYYNGRLYIGLYTTDGPELVVFDVVSTPASPTFVGAIASSFNHSIYDIVINGNYAYLATGYDSRELMIVNISASTPVDTGLGYNANLTGGDTEEATALFLVNKTLYMGRERTNNAAERDLYIFDITNPTVPSVLGSKRLGLGSNTEVTGIAVVGPYAFLSTSDSNGGFQIWNVGSPANISQPFGCMTYNYSEKSRGLMYRDDLIFIANESNKALRVIYDQPSSC